MKFFAKAAVWVVATVALAAIAFPAGQDLPAGDGKAIIEAKCTLCHDVSTATERKQSKEEWTDIVKTMQSYGSPISDEEVPVVIDYLTKNFLKGGATPSSDGAAANSEGAKAADAENLPPGEGRELVGLACTECHDLTNVKSEKMSKDEWKDTVERMVSYGSSLDEKSVAIVVNYLAANFHK